MQRGRFCLTGGFRDMYIAKNNRMFYALLIAISVQSVGVFALIQAGLLTYEAGAFPWLGTVIGGYLFGLGIVRACHPDFSSGCHNPSAFVFFAGKVCVLRQSGSRSMCGKRQNHLLSR